MKILYAGTADFAVLPLKKLLEHGFEVCGVITKPDMPKGRGMAMAFSPVKQAATELGLPIFQPGKLDKSVLELMEQLKPDMLIAVAYGKLIPEFMLNFPALGAINVHGSILPKYRGAAPIQWSVLNGDKQAGVTTMYMDKGMDTGDIIDIYQTDILPYETAGQLYDRLSVQGAQLLVKTLTDITGGKIHRTPQDNSIATQAPVITKEMSPIDWTKPAARIINRICGLNPWPSASTTANGKRVKIHAAVLTGENGQGAPGTVLASREGTFLTMCGDGQIIAVTQIQFEGKRKMTPGEYLVGNPMIERFE